VVKASSPAHCAAFVEKSNDSELHCWFFHREKSF
jgi:hypothetical protein